eukprot:scaffold34578_cov32-Phaeocystis_antarctica.AAC.1
MECPIKTDWDRRSHAAMAAAPLSPWRPKLPRYNPAPTTLIYTRATGDRTVHAPRCGALAPSCTLHRRCRPLLCTVLHLHLGASAPGCTGTEVHARCLAPRFQVPHRVRSGIRCVFVSASLWNQKVFYEVEYLLFGVQLLAGPPCPLFTTCAVTSVTVDLVCLVGAGHPRWGSGVPSHVPRS